MNQHHDEILQMYCTYMCMGESASKLADGKYVICLMKLSITRSSQNMMAFRNS